MATRGIVAAEWHAAATIPRVSMLTRTPATVEPQPSPIVTNNQTSEVGNPGVPNSTILDDNILRDAGMLDDEVRAPSGGVQAIEFPHRRSFMIFIPV